MSLVKTTDNLSHPQRSGGVVWAAIKCSTHGTDRSLSGQRSHPHIFKRELSAHLCVCVGQSPYRDNDQGVCGFPLIVSRVERQAFISKSFTHTNTHGETRSCRYLMELNVTLNNLNHSSIPALHWYSSNRLLSPTVMQTALNLSVKAAFTHKSQFTDDKRRYLEECWWHNSLGLV